MWVYDGGPIVFGSELYLHVLEISIILHCNSSSSSQISTGNVLINPDHTLCVVHFIHCRLLRKTKARERRVKERRERKGKRG